MNDKLRPIKRAMTMTVKTAAATAAVAAGTYAVNRYLQSRNTTLNGKPVVLGRQQVNNVINLAKKGKDLLGFVF